MSLRVALVVLAALAVGCVGGLEGQERPPPEARVEDGRKLFIEHGCHGCHMVGALGSSIGPDLSRIGSKYRAEYLERWLRDPAAVRPHAHMPKLELNEQQVKLLAAFLASLR